jgi:hypothetical protein
MKSAILVFVLISLIGCTEGRKKDNESVKYEFKTFFIGNTDQIEEKEQLPHNISNEQKKHIPMHNSRIYDPLFLSNDTNIEQKEPINLKASKIIKLGKEEIKLFDKHSPVITVDEIKKLRAQTN